MAFSSIGKSHNSHTINCLWTMALCFTDDLNATCSIVVMAESVGGLHFLDHKVLGRKQDC